ncbi:MAG TPA: TetR/AcrR family transcriptional regulator [Acidobacteriaceae bacterium]
MTVARLFINRYIIHRMAGRPRSFDRDSALDTALDAFWRAGYEQTSVSQLTQAIGIQPPSLYAAFSSKDKLFAEAAERYLERFHRGLMASLDRAGTREAIAALLEAAARAHTRPGTPPGCLVLSEPRLRGERENMRAQIAERLRRGQRDGDLSPEVEAGELAALIEAVLAGMSARARDGGTLEELQAISRLALSLLPVPH